MGINRSHGVYRSARTHTCGSRINTGRVPQGARSSFKTAPELSQTFPVGVLASQACPYCYNTGYSSPGTRCSYCRRGERLGPSARALKRGPLVRLALSAGGTQPSWLAFASDLRSDNLPGYDDFDAAVLLPTFGSVVVGHRIVHPHALR